MAFETVTGYCWPQSVAPGEQVALHLSSPGGRSVRVEVARVGWKREVVLRDEAVRAEFHDTPEGADAQGCGWPPARMIDVDPAWRSGYYEVLLEVEVDGKQRQSHAFFVVRPEIGRPTAPMLLALSTNTWHAYNDFGGKNLYTGGTSVALQRPMTAGFLHKPPGAGRRVTTVQIPDPQMTAHVGYLRLNHLSPWAGSAGWPDWELPFLRWAEREGYAIDVVTNADLEDHPELLSGEGAASYPLYLSVGHDEYWSKGMRDCVEGFIARGGHAAFLSGNTAFWQVRLEDPTPEGPASTLVGYKALFNADPVSNTDRADTLSCMWSDRLLGRPENRMTGVSFARGGYHRIGKRATRGAGGYTVHRPDHWLFEGTGVGYGDLIGAGGTTVGYECDGCHFEYRDGLPVATGIDGTPEDFTILGTAPAAHFTHETATRPPPPGLPSEVEYIASRMIDGGRTPEDVERFSHGHAVLGTYTSPGGGVVVTSGSTDWAHGLGGRDPEIEGVTRNLLERLSVRRG